MCANRIKFYLFKNAKNESIKITLLWWKGYERKG